MRQCQVTLQSLQTQLTQAQESLQEAETTEKAGLDADSEVRRKRMKVNWETGVSSSMSVAAGCSVYRLKDIFETKRIERETAHSNHCF